MIGTSDAWTAAAHHFGLGPKPCAIRIAPNAHTFDESFADQFDTIAGGRTLGGFYPAGRTFFLKELDESRVSEAGWTAVHGVFAEPAWRTVGFDLGAGAEARLEPVEAIPPSAGGIVWFPVDGRTYLANATIDGSQTTIVRTSEHDEPGIGLQLPGMAFSAVKVRPIAASD